MKRNDWKIILGALVFTYLFYEQHAGINFLLFAIVTTILLALNTFQNFSKPSVIISLTGTLVSAFFIYLYGTPLPQIAFVLSLSLLTAFAFEPKSSLLVAGLHGFASILLAIPSAIGRLFRNVGNEQVNEFKLNKLYLLILPLLITLLFFFLYRVANPNFLAFTKDLNFDWLSLPLVRFFIFGCILLYGLLTKQVINYFERKDLEAKNQITIQTANQHQASFVGKRLSLQSELFIGISLFIMLNLLLGLVNGIDLIQLWPNQVLPEDTASYSQYLHNGVQMLIVSILLAIGIILFFFRGYVNFLKEARWLKILGMIWIAQNILLLASTAIRNQMYVEAYGLSHKRIGVFIYLLLAAIGLILTSYKLLTKKNNGFLFRANAWAFYLVLILATPISWDQMITKFNFQLAGEKEKDPDIDYLSLLSHTNTAQLIPYFKIGQLDLFEHSGLNMNANYSLNRKFVDFLSLMENKDWQSSCLSRENNYVSLLEQHENGALESIVLRANQGSLSSIIPLKHLKSLVIQNNNFNDDWNLLLEFKELETLNLQNNYYNLLDSLPVMPNLKALNLSHNYIYSISKLSEFKQLERLDISYNDILDYSPLYELTQLKTLYVNEQDPEVKLELQTYLPHTEILFTSVQEFKSH